MERNACSVQNFPILKYQKPLETTYFMCLSQIKFLHKCMKFVDLFCGALYHNRKFKKCAAPLKLARPGAYPRVEHLKGALLE
jgi:hypothetical protein